MKRALAIIQILLAFIHFACQEKPLDKGKSLYFDKSELSDVEWIDSLSNQHYSNKLISLEEPSLKDTSNHNETIRLTVFPSSYNTYCIRLDKLDSMYTISFKIEPDPKELRRTGLNSLTLNYKSDFEKMGTIYLELMRWVNALDIFEQDNSTPKIVIQKGAVGADGTDLLLEYYKDGRYVALVRWDGFLKENFYNKSEEFLKIVKNLNSLVPIGLLPDLETAREIEDVRFPVFKNDNK